MRSRDLAGRTPEDGKPSEVLGPWPEVEGPAWRLRLLEGQSLSPPIQHDSLERLFTLPPPSRNVRLLGSTVLKTFILYYVVRINVNIFGSRIYSLFKRNFGLVKSPLSCYYSAVVIDLVFFITQYNNIKIKFIYFRIENINILLNAIFYVQINAFNSRLYSLQSRDMDVMYDLTECQKAILCLNIGLFLLSYS